MLLSFDIKDTEYDTKKPVPESLSKQDINNLFDYAARGDAPKVEEWISKFGRESLNHKSFTSWTALMFAAREGRQDVVLLLLKHGADPSIKNDLGHDARFYALKMNYTDTAQALDAATTQRNIAQESERSAEERRHFDNNIKNLKKHASKKKFGL